MEKNKVRLTIGGLDYRLTTDDDVSYIKNLAEELDESIEDMMRAHPKLSQVQAAVLCALEYADRYHGAQKNAEFLKAQIQVYMEDAAKAKTQAEVARREAERMTRDLRSIRRSLEEKDKI